MELVRINSLVCKTWMAIWSTIKVYNMRYSGSNIIKVFPCKTNFLSLACRVMEIKCVIEIKNTY